MITQEWQKILRRRIGADGGIIVSSIGDKVEVAIKRGSAWIAEQEATRPIVAGLCLEYISKYIARRSMLILGCLDSEEKALLSQLVNLADQLERRGIDTSKISREILEDIASK